MGTMAEPNLELLLLGTGTCVPSVERNSSGYAVRYGATILLLDIGNGIQKRLLEAKVDYRYVDGIFISHFHPDHTTDLIPFLFATRHTPGFSRIDPLILAGARGLRDFVDNMSEIYGHWVKQPGFPLEVRELDSDKVEVGPLKIRSVPVNHSENALAFRVTAPNGKSLTYSGDTGFCDSIVRLAKDTDLLLIECSFPTAMRINGHLTPPEVAKIARDCNCKRVVLTHLYPVFGDENPADEVSRYFDGEVILGEDLMRLQI